jgi:hypothetical protein
VRGDIRELDVVAEEGTVAIGDRGHRLWVHRLQPVPPWR